VSARTTFELASYPADLLQLEPEAIEALVEADDRLERVTTTLVEPGEPVRITHALDAVEPRVRPDGRPAFPGVTGEPARAGTGRTNGLAGVLVVPCIDFPGEETPQREQDGVIDLGGPAQHLTRCGGARVVVLEFVTAGGVPHRLIEEAVRTVTLRASELLAEPTLARSPDDVQRFDLAEPTRRLPRVAVLLQLASRGKQLMDVRYYGEVVGRVDLPSPISPFEILDGAVTCGEYHWAAVRNPTIAYQRNRLIIELTRQHAKAVDFAGVIAMRGHSPTADHQQRAADRAAELAASLGADGVIVTVDASGYAHTDAMLTVRACEARGIATTVIVAEIVDPSSPASGLIDWVSEATSIISVGNIEELAPAWKPDRVLGGSRLLDGSSAAAEQPIPIRHYLGAACQMGDMNLTARTW
jgi:hypothetical protein